MFEYYAGFLFFIYLLKFYMFIFELIISFPSTHKPVGNIYETLYE